MRNSGPCFGRSSIKKIVLLLSEMSYIQLFTDKYIDLFIRKGEILFS